MSELKCTVKNCERVGVPAEGFDFYVCDPCLEELERLLQAQAIQRVAQNN